MLRLDEYLAAIDGVNHTPRLNPEEIVITDGYACDMLSDVMGSAKPGQAWITIMKHLNTVAVASMTGIPAIILAKGGVPDAAVVDKASDEGICVITSPFDTFRLAGLLYLLLNR